MPIVKAAALHLDAVQRLLQHATYRYVDMGREDLPGLLTQAAVVGEEQGTVWGFLGVQVESRPPTLPAPAPTRAHVRAVALQRGRLPAADLAALLDAALARRDVAALQAVDGSLQVICYGADRWIGQALVAAGFVQVEAVQFFELDRLPARLAELPVARPDVELTPAQPAHLPELALLDAAAFPPLWHFGARDLFEMLMRCRMQIAWLGGRMAGYTALCANSAHELQLARLAVAPGFQGMGVGRTLLADAVRYAAGEYTTLVLNTQTTNTRSQKLYRGFGFRPTGTAVPVLARTLIQRVALSQLPPGAQPKW